jgi:hypothetical protein
MHLVDDAVDGEEIRHEVPFPMVAAPIVRHAFAILVNRDALVAVPHRGEVMPLAGLPAAKIRRQLQRRRVIADVVKVEQELRLPHVEAHQHTPVAILALRADPAEPLPFADRWRLLRLQEEGERAAVEVDLPPRLDPEARAGLADDAHFLAVIERLVK